MEPQQQQFLVDSVNKFTPKQLQYGLDKMKARNKARKKARAEEKDFVEYRKQAILASNRTKYVTIRQGDDLFPKRRPRSMGFGERKAHYLSIRPKPQFATWIGRKKGTIQAKPPAQPEIVQFTDHSALPETTAQQEISVKPAKDKKAVDSSTKVIKAKPQVPEMRTVATQTDKPVKVEKRGGNRSGNPLVGNSPFWTVSAGNETDEITDEDLPVDMDILERVCSGDLTLLQKPFQKTKFNPFGAMQRFKFDDTLFIRDTALFTSTIEAVIALQPDEDIDYKRHPPIERKIRWSDRIKVIHYDHLDRNTPLDAPVFEELKDIRREKTDKK